MYSKIKTATFINRPNRFIANVNIDGNIEKIHVKNTGRCKELLVPDAKVILEDCSDNKNRKTRYSLISVYKDNKLINMDSQIPNTVVFEALNNGQIREIQNITFCKKEQTYKNSRFDIYYEKDDIKGFIEVKGVTLEKNGVTMFPDAPTTRGMKHVLEMIDAVKNGYEGNILFLIQMEDVSLFRLNWEMDEDFSKAVLKAYNNNVNILVYNSVVNENSIVLKEQIPFDLERKLQE